MIIFVWINNWASLLLWMLTFLLYLKKMIEYLVKSFIFIQFSLFVILKEKQEWQHSKIEAQEINEQKTNKDENIHK